MYVCLNACLNHLLIHERHCAQCFLCAHSLIPRQYPHFAGEFSHVRSHSLSVTTSVFKRTPVYCQSPCAFLLACFILL